LEVADTSAFAHYKLIDVVLPNLKTLKGYNNFYDNQQLKSFSALNLKNFCTFSFEKCPQLRIVLAPNAVANGATKIF
jgi:hypothetical protein